METKDAITPPFHQNCDNNFSDDELVRPHRTWLIVSQNSTKGVGQKSNHSWALIVNFFKKLGGEGVGVCSQVGRIKIIGCATRNVKVFKNIYKCL